MANFYTPNTAVHLCNVPLNQNNKNQIALYAGDADNGILWSNGSLSDKKNAQLKFFTDRTTHVFTDFTYQRKDNIIRVPVNAEVLFADGTNYCVYQNTHYNGKWFYCYITRIEFINENMTALHIKTDVFQTWFFEWYKNNHMDVNFIARNTVLNDDKYKHTLPEPLPQPMYKTINDNEQYAPAPSAMIQITPDLKARNENEFNQNYWCAVFTSEEIKNLTSSSVPVSRFLGGIPCGCRAYAMSTDVLEPFFNVVALSGQVEAIVSCVAIPKSMVEFHNINSPTPTPPTPTPLPPIADNYLGSPYASSFFVTQIYNPTQHYGIDLDNNDNLNIYATTDGLVVGAGFHGSGSGASGTGFGNIVVIQSTSYPTGDSDYYYFMYCHMETITVSPGDTVHRGDHIGVQGETGESDGSHCHYEVQKKGDTGIIYTGQMVGAVFGHRPFSGESINPTLFTQFPNQEGYY